jgi:AraC-like DNA-binding protein
MQFYQITKEAMDNQIVDCSKIIEGHVYVWTSNGHVNNNPQNIPVVLSNSDGSVKKIIGVIDATHYKLKKCTRNEAQDRSWELGGFRNKWDVFNRCYREDLCDAYGNPIEIMSLKDLARRTHMSEKDLIHYFESEGFDIINK